MTNSIQELKQEMDMRLFVYTEALKAERHLATLTELVGSDFSEALAQVKLIKEALYDAR